MRSVRWRRFLDRKNRALSPPPLFFPLPPPFLLLSNLVLPIRITPSTVRPGVEAG